MATQKDRIEKLESEFLELKTSMDKIETEWQVTSTAIQSLTSTLTKFMEHPSITNDKSSKTFESDTKWSFLGF
jgi:chromosome segregation ATPase